MADLARSIEKFGNVELMNCQLYPLESKGIWQRWQFWQLLPHIPPPRRKFWQKIWQLAFCKKSYLAKIARIPATFPKIGHF